MTRIIVCMLLAASWTTVSAVGVHTKSEDTFNRYLAELQKKPDDKELLKKIIQMAGRLRPAPEIPKEARGHFSKAYSAQREAKSPKDYETAVEEYGKALALAPWWAAAYYHLGTAYERLGKYDAATDNLRLYLASDPGHAGEREALDRIKQMEGEKRKAGKKPTTEN